MALIKSYWKLIPILMMLITPMASVYSATVSPLPNASVDVTGDNGEAFIFTGADGTFVITQGLGAGTYTVEISHTGYITAKMNATISKNVETNLGDIQLATSGRIEGIVQSPTGSPVSNVTVMLMDQANHTVDYAFTSSGGSFTFDTDVKTGTYTITTMIVGPGYSGYASNQKGGVAATEGQTTSGVVVQLKSSGRISGYVKDKSGNPISNVTIWAFLGTSYSGLEGSFATTDSLGRYLIDSNLPTGNYQVYILLAKGFVYSFLTDYKNASVTAGMETTVNFDLDRSGIISGTITLSSNGAPAPNITVSAYSTDFKYFGSATTGADGKYRMDSGLGTGQYQVMAAGDYMGIKTVSVTAGAETSGVDFQITSNLAWIAGKVVNSTGGPIEFADLQAESDMTLDFSSTDDKGKYTMEIEVPEGENSLVLNVTASQKGYDPSSKSVTVNLGQTTSPVDFTLQRTAGGTLRGRVVAAYVAPPKQTATLSVQSSATSIGVGSPVTISGSLSASRSGTVTIYQSVNGSAFTTLTTVSMSNGAYTYSYTPSSLGTYQFKASWPGDDQYNSAESTTVTVTVSTTPKQTATLSIQSSATTVNVGSAVTISGSISPSRSGSVTISLSVNGSAFTTLTTVSLSNGAYTYSYTPSSNGTYQFKASWPGDDQYNPAESSITTVTASTQQPPASACVIATATYGSELSPQVQLLRNFRENIALKTFAGSSFMTAFNAWYYSWSPPVATAIAPDNAARATMRVVLQPILNILQIATVTFTSLSFNGEFAIIMAGFVAASLIGLVYLMPITTVALVAINKLSRYKSLPRMSQLRILVVPWIASIILMLLGELSALPALMMLATSAFVVTTILLVVGSTSLKIAKTLVKL